MPLEDLTSIDIVATAENGCVELFITDSGITSDPVERYSLLQKKLGLYLAVITGGELKEEYPGFSPSHCVIRVICALPPTLEMLAVGSITPKGVAKDKAIPVKFELLGLDGEEFGLIARSPLIVPDITKSLSGLVEFALSKGTEIIKMGRPLARSFWIEGEEIHAAEHSTDLHPQEAAKKRISTLPTSIQICAVVFDGLIDLDGGEKSNAVIVEASERGKGQGVVFVQRYKPKKLLKRFDLIDEKVFLSTCPNLFD